MRRLRQLSEWRRRAANRSHGQALVLFAAGLAGLLGLVGMSIDIGRLAYSRTALQRTADAAALAGAQELARTVPDTVSATGSANQYILTNDDGAAGAIAATITFSSTAATNDTIHVTVSKPVQHTFLKFVGVSGATVTASATVRARVATGFAFDDVDVFPYAVWGGARSTPPSGCPYNICVGSTQTYRANNFHTASNAIGPDWAVNGNNFKGYFHHGGNVVQIDPATWQTFSSGGNAIGQEPIAALQAHAASGEPIIVPVIQQAECTGGCGTIKFKIVAWVALKITTVPGNSATPFTGVVVADYSSPLGASGGTPPPASFPVIRTLSMAE